MAAAANSGGKPGGSRRPREEVVMPALALLKLLGFLLWGALIVVGLCYLVVLTAGVALVLFVLMVTLLFAIGD